ncbi:MAG TPA: hypothetical protein EYN66_23810 [Myxococcales bacterium]|nr:hypothetical protein [Myxococcales bacterium]
MSTRECGQLADIIIDSLETAESGQVRTNVQEHLNHCNTCQAHRGVLMELAHGLDPIPYDLSMNFVSRVMNEIRQDNIGVPSAYDRLPPLWQVLGAGVLFVALSAVVLATGGGNDWHQQIVTGYLDDALHFLGGLSQAIRGLWDAVAPGKGLPILIGCAVIATILNIGFMLGTIRKKKETVD